MPPFLLLALSFFNAAAQEQPVKCKNLQPECQEWALAGDCIKDREYMDKFCPDSCNTQCLAKRNLLSSMSVADQVAARTRSAVPPLNTRASRELPISKNIPTREPAGVSRRDDGRRRTSTTKVRSNPLSLFRARQQPLEGIGVEDWAASSMGRGECVNKHRACLKWAEQGECLRDEEFMLQVCALSCDAACGGRGPRSGPPSRSAIITPSSTAPVLVTFESYEQTASNARSPLTTLDSLFSSTNNAVSDHCTNRHEVCDTWAAKGECELYPALMKQVCPKSCLKECKSIPAYVPPGPVYVPPTQQNFFPAAQTQQFVPNYAQSFQAQQTQPQYFPTYPYQGPAPSQKQRSASYPPQQPYYPPQQQRRQQQQFYPQGPSYNPQYQQYQQQQKPYSFGGGGGAAPPGILPPHTFEQREGQKPRYSGRGGAGAYGGSAVQRYYPQQQQYYPQAQPAFQPQGGPSYSQSAQPYASQSFQAQPYPSQDFQTQQSYPPPQRSSQSYPPEQPYYPPISPSPSSLSRGSPFEFASESPIGMRASQLNGGEFSSTSRSSRPRASQLSSRSQDEFDFGAPPLRASQLNRNSQDDFNYPPAQLRASQLGNDPQDDFDFGGDFGGDFGELPIPSRASTPPEDFSFAVPPRTAPQRTTSFARNAPLHSSRIAAPRTDRFVEGAATFGGASFQEGSDLPRVAGSLDDDFPSFGSQFPDSSGIDSLPIPSDWPDAQESRGSPSFGSRQVERFPSVDYFEDDRTSNS